MEFILLTKVKILVYAETEERKQELLKALERLEKVTDRIQELLAEEGK